jgi:hypothetical protein
MYCSPEYHSETADTVALETLQKVWLKVFEKTSMKNLKYKITITGGEPTANKNFLPFMTWLRQNYHQHLHQVLVTTNGSASLAYYSKLFGLVDNISFSLHSEHIDEKRFFDMVLNLRKKIHPKKFIHVNIMNEFWNQNRIVKYKEILDSNSISNSINGINYKTQTRTFPIFKGNLNLEI